MHEHQAEIFSAGTWNGDEYTVEDLHDTPRSTCEGPSRAATRSALSTPFWNGITTPPFDTMPASLGAVDWSLSGPAFYGSHATGLRPLVLPFVVGNLALGALAAATVFLLLRTPLARRRPSP